jgi:molybdopterin-dependent oxidoreductase alpha subunit
MHQSKPEALEQTAPALGAEAQPNASTTHQNRASESGRTLADEADGSHAEAEHGNGIRAEPPESSTGLRVTSPAQAAAGLKSVVSSMSYVWSEMGISRGLRALLALNQKGGFDCTSCAWPDPDGARHTAEFCENGARAMAWEGDSDRITPNFFRTWSVAELSQRSDYWLGKQGRLTEPMVLRAGASHYEPIAWPDAFRMVGEALNRLPTPDDAMFYTSGRTSNEAAFLYQLFVRQFGTNNLPDCSNMCHESSGSALTPTIGIGKGTVKLDDFDKAQLILIIGQNPGTNHPRMLTALQRAKRNGCKIIAANPLPEAGLLKFKNPQEALGLLGFGTPLSDLFLQVRINGDAALLKGVAKCLLEAEDRQPGSALDMEFVRAKTTGFDELVADLRALSWDDLVEQSGISRQQITEAARLFQQSERIIACWAMGLTQHKNAVATIQDVVNLLLLRGSIGKPGAGVCPVRGHSNVQGDRTMGIWERPRPEFLDKLQEVFGFEPPRKHGLSTVEAIKAMHAHPGKVFFALGGNFLSATPDTEYTAAALRRCALTAHVATKLNRSHLITGREALLLPCLGRTEHDQQTSGPQFVSCENSMGVVQSSQGTLAPASEHLLSEPALVAGLAQATFGQRTTVDWQALVSDYDRIRDLIARVIPGCSDYNTRVRQPGGFYLPNFAREGTFKTATGKANFTVHPLPVNHLEPGQLVMMTIRTHDQFNTTIYGLQDRYRGIHNERRVILLNAEDMRELGLHERQVVDLTSHFNGETRVARRFLVVPYDIPRRCAATYFPETNVLVPIDSVAEKSLTPTSKYVLTRVTPAPAEAPVDYDRVVS